MPNVPVGLSRSQILRLLDGQTVQVPTGVGLLEVKAKSDQRWQPMKRIQIPKHMVSGMRFIGTEPPDELWTNGEYEVMVYYMDGHPDTEHAKDPNGTKHLSIKRMDRAAVRNWRHFQQIKNEVCGEGVEALELFPSEGRITDNANQHHLWVMPPGVEIPVGWPAGFVTLDPDEVDEYNTNGDPGRQEPLQEGLTMGLAMDAHQKKHGGGAMAEVAEQVRKGVLRVR